MNPKKHKKEFGITRRIFDKMKHSKSPELVFIDSEEDFERFSFDDISFDEFFDDLSEVGSKNNGTNICKEDEDSYNFDGIINEMVGIAETMENVPSEFIIKWAKDLVKAR